MKEEKIKCKTCGKEHQKTTSNCCWISCKCGNSICGNCGSNRIREMEMPEEDDEAKYWCCKECNECGLQGCGMCI